MMGGVKGERKVFGTNTKVAGTNTRVQYYTQEASCGLLLERSISRNRQEEIHTG